MAPRHDSRSGTSRSRSSSSVSTTVILLGCIWTFNIFVVIFFITGGGPGGKTEILVTYTYNGFTLGQYAIAATYGVLIFSLLLVFSSVYRRLAPRVVRSPR